MQSSTVARTEASAGGAAETMDPASPIYLTRKTPLPEPALIKYKGNERVWIPAARRTFASWSREPPTWDLTASQALSRGSKACELPFPLILPEPLGEI